MAEPVAVYIDGASRGNPGPAGVGVAFVDGKGKVIHTLHKYLGETTNNVAEYLALVYALHEAQRHGCQRLTTIRTDSELLARQINGQYKVRDHTLRLFHDLARHAMQGFQQLRIEHVGREQNREADRLAGKAVDGHRANLTTERAAG